MYDDMVASRGLQHISDEFRSDGSPRLVLFILSSVREARNDGRNPSCGSGTTRINHDEQFHEGVVDVIGPRLNNKDVLVPNRLSCRQSRFQRSYQ